MIILGSTHIVATRGAQNHSDAPAIVSTRTQPDFDFSLRSSMAPNAVTAPVCAASSGMQPALRSNQEGKSNPILDTSLKSKEEMNAERSLESDQQPIPPSATDRRPAAANTRAGQNQACCTPVRDTSERKHAISLEDVQSPQLLAQQQTSPAAEMAPTLTEQTTISDISVRCPVNPPEGADKAILAESSVAVTGLSVRPASAPLIPREASEALPDCTMEAKAHRITTRVAESRVPKIDSPVQRMANPRPLIDEKSVLPMISQPAATSWVKAAPDEKEITSVVKAAKMSQEGFHAIAATSKALEIGVPYEAHGWLRVRAELATGGAISASLVAGDQRLAEVLRRDLPTLSTYLSAEHVVLNSLVVVSATASMGTQDLTKDFSKAMPYGQVGGGLDRSPQGGQDGQKREEPGTSGDADDHSTKGGWLGYVGHPVHLSGSYGGWLSILA